MAQCNYQAKTIQGDIRYCILEEGHSGRHRLADTDEPFIIFEEVAEMPQEHWELIAKIMAPDGSVSAIAMLEEIKRLTREGEKLRNDLKYVIAEVFDGWERGIGTHDCVIAAQQANNYWELIDWGDEEA